MTSSADPATLAIALLSGAVGAAVLTIIGGFVGAWIQSRREHRRWVREQRLDAYSTFLAEVRKRSIEAAENPFSTKSEPMMDASARIALLGPEPVASAGDAAVDFIIDRLVGTTRTPEQTLDAIEELDALDGDLMDAMIKAVGIKH